MRNLRRIVFLTSVHHAYDPRILFREATTLAAKGYDVHLVAQHERFEEVEGVSIHGQPPLPNYGRGARGLAKAALHRRLIRTAYGLRPDVVHIHDPELIPAAWVLRRLTRCRVVYDRHEDYGVRRGLEGGLLRQLERWAWRWVDHTVVAEEAYAEPLLERGVSCTAVLNYYRPVGLEATEAMDKSGSPWVVVYAGVQSLARGGRVLVDVARRANEAGLPWTIRMVGPCYRLREREEIDRLIEQAEVGAYIQQIGWTHYVPYPELLAWTARAHVGLALLDPLPDYLQSVPTKFYEYASMGIPFISSNFPLWNDFVDRYGCGVTVDPHDGEAVFSQLLRWYEDRAEYARYRSAALAAAPAFSWEHMAKRLLKVYEEVTGCER